MVLSLEACSDCVKGTFGVRIPPPPVFVRRFLANEACHGEALNGRSRTSRLCIIAANYALAGHQHGISLRLFTPKYSRR